MDQTEGKAIQVEVVVDECLYNSNRPKAATFPRKPASEIKKKPNSGRMISETIQLCCVTMKTGPGTGFGEFNIPKGFTCSVCGSGVEKGRD